MELTIGLAAAVAALASAMFVWLQVREMQRQTDLQREVARSSAQPYVWADVRLQSTNGWMLEMVVGNSGPTVATNVRIQVSPPFPLLEREAEYVEAMHDRLARGLSSLAPGRTLHWTLGPSVDLVNRDGSLAHSIQIDCDGPFGPVERSDYVIDMADFRESVARHDGTMRDIAKEVHELGKKLVNPRRAIRVQVDTPDDLEP